MKIIHYIALIALAVDLFFAFQLNTSPSDTHSKQDLQEQNSSKSLASLYGTTRGGSALSSSLVDLQDMERNAEVTKFMPLAKIELPAQTKHKHILSKKRKVQNHKKKPKTTSTAPKKKTPVTNYSQFKSVPMADSIATSVMSDQLTDAAHYAKKWGKRMAKSGRYHPSKSITHCNRFTTDLVNKILGEASPFGQELLDWYTANGRYGRAHDQYLYCVDMLKQEKYFEEITGESINAKFEKAWEAANQGKLVMFLSPQQKRKRRTEPGHFAIAVPSEKFRSTRDRQGNVYWVGRVVQAGRSILDGDRKLTGRGGHSYLSNAWSPSKFGNIRVFVFKGTGRP
ncbi:MAG: hypothetical protein MK212_18270 [Saprospiraceae bacterium]|nr:hypothetical protein [Saprospiraceae bacterium]